MQLVEYEEVDGKAILSADTTGEWIKSDRIVVVADWN